MLPKTAAAIAAATITLFMPEPRIIIRPKWISGLECLKNHTLMANHNGRIG